MQQRDNKNRLSQEYTNSVLLNGTLQTPRWWPYLVSVLAFFCNNWIHIIWNTN